MLSAKAKILLCILLVVCLDFTGCSDSANDRTPETTISNAAEYGDTATPKLQITMVADFSLGMTVFTSDELDGSFNNDLRYFNVSDVCITIGSNTLPLENALKEGFITEEEIFCFARSDAAKGFCREEVQSKHGLSHFTYRYPDCNIRLIYDVYETPDGQQHLISDMAVYPTDMILGIYTDFLDPETMNYLDRENWGLTLEIAGVTPNGLTLSCKQEGGQQLGQLILCQYSLSDGERFIDRLDKNSTLPVCEIAIAMDSNSEILIDWEDIYGDLPSGNYNLGLYVRDSFTEDTVHPLMHDYHKEQSYSVFFEIP